MLRHLAALKPFLQRYYFIIGIILAIIAYILTSNPVTLAINPPGFYVDEAANAVDAYNLIKTKRDMHGELLPVVFKSLGDGKSPVFIYSAIPFVYLLGLTENTVRLVAYLYGLLGVLAIGLLGKTLFNPAIGVLSAVILAISPWYTHIHRIGFELSSMVPWLILSLLFFIKATKDKRFTIPAVIALLLLYGSYTAAKLYFLPVIVILCLMYRKELSVWYRTRVGLIALVLLVVGLMFLTVRPMLDGTFQLRWQQVYAESSVNNVIKNYFSHFSVEFLLLHGTSGYPGFSNIFSLPNLGVLTKAQFILAAFGLGAILFKRAKIHSAWLVLMLLFIYPLGSIFTGSVPFTTRSVIGTVPFALLAGIGSYFLLKTVKRNVSVGIYYTFLSCMVVVFIWSVIQTNRAIEDYYFSASDLNGWSYGYSEIIDYAIKAQKDYDEIIFVDRGAEYINLAFYDYPKECAKCRFGWLREFSLDKKQLFFIKPDYLPIQLEELNRDISLPFEEVHRVLSHTGSVNFVAIQFEVER